jgi:hypothetical protein
VKCGDLLIGLRPLRFFLMSPYDPSAFLRPLLRLVPRRTVAIVPRQPVSNERVKNLHIADPIVFEQGPDVRVVFLFEMGLVSFAIGPGPGLPGVGGFNKRNKGEAGQKRNEDPVNHAGRTGETSRFTRGNCFLRAIYGFNLPDSISHPQLRHVQYGAGRR